MIESRFHLSTIDRVLIAMRKPDLRAAWREARVPLRNDMKDHRQQRRGPDGPWAPRAETTKARARYGKRPRRILGKLPTALQTISTRSMVAMKSRVAWSEVQQRGGTVGRGSKIPGRDWLYASQLALNAIGTVIERHLAKLWNRGG